MKPAIQIGKADARQAMAELQVWETGALTPKSMKDAMRGIKSRVRMLHFKTSNGSGSLMSSIF